VRFSTSAHWVYGCQTLPEVGGQVPPVVLRQEVRPALHGARAPRGQVTQGAQVQVEGVAGPEG